jgi:glycosyltransferase involved in cell wall biosynthesis
MNEFEQALQQTAVVIPSFRGRQLLERLLPSIDVPPVQVLVVDQGGDDGSEEYCRGAGVQVLLLGREATFAAACNAGIRWAMDHGFRYICVAKNDLQFVTPVVHQLLATCLDNARAGAAAPTLAQLQQGDLAEVAYGARWDLSSLTLSRVPAPLPDGPRDVDADFCEFACAMVPTAVFEDVGLLDEDYGPYGQDADFGFRLWLKGYRALYNQHAQVVQRNSSGMNGQPGFRRTGPLQRRNRELFAAKHPGSGVNFLQENDRLPVEHSFGVIVDAFSRTLRPLGMLRPDGPDFALGHPGHVGCQYLYTIWETTRLPSHWRETVGKYEAVFTASDWGRDVFLAEGFPSVHTVPLGVDLNVFHAEGERHGWASGHGFPAGKVFLVNARLQHRKALDVTIAAWLAVKDRLPGAALVLYCPGPSPSAELWDGQETEAFYEEELNRKWHAGPRIGVLQPRHALSFEKMAQLYRGAHCLVMNSRSEGFGLPVVEAMACGTLCIVPDYSATAAFVRPGNCLPISGTPAIAEYGDKGFGPVGSWWEPSLDGLTRQMIRAYHMPDEERREITGKARRMVEAEYTWRNMARVLYAQLGLLQGNEAPRKRRRGSASRTGVPGHRPRRHSVANRLIRAGILLQNLGFYLGSHGLMATVRKSVQALLGRKLP